MNDAVATIAGLERRVMWRKRLLSLRDNLALAAAIGGLIAATSVLIVRLRLIEATTWIVVSAAIGLSLAAALIRWFLTRMRLPDAAFLIDKALDLDDRFATSRLIVEQGGPCRAVEEALIQDTAERVKAHRAASIVSLRTPRWYSLAFVAIAGLAAVLFIPQRSLPIAESLAAERVDIESAGEHLEQTSTEVEQSAPAGTETAALAKEQAEVGRGFRRSTATRAEALRRLSALEERIRGRHDELASTRADEIVSLADRRLGDALPTLTTARRKLIGPAENQAGAEELGAASNRELSKSGQPIARIAGDKSPESPKKSDGPSEPPESRSRQQPKAPEKTDVAASNGKGRPKPAPQNRPQEPVSGEASQKAHSPKGDSTRQNPALLQEASDQPGASTDRGQKLSKPNGGSDKQDDQRAQAKKADDQHPGEQASGALDALKGVPTPLAEQAGKSLPKLSEELLKKAAELRADELSAADVERLRKAAESLSRDLAQIAQSKELQQALQEMARQVRPEQIEQVARELGNQEQLKQELEASTRLLSENQQAKEMVAGLVGQFARMQEQRRWKEKGQGGGNKTDARNEESGLRDQASMRNRRSGTEAPANLETSADRRLAGQGKKATLKGKVQTGSQGEYLYLQAKTGVGAASAPYASAYPQYRREAERSVQRSRVPAGLRSVVRRYFDAINPDAKR